MRLPPSRACHCPAHQHQLQLLICHQAVTACACQATCACRYAPYAAAVGGILVLSAAGQLLPGRGLSPPNVLWRLMVDGGALLLAAPQHWLFVQASPLTACPACPRWHPHAAAQAAIKEILMLLLLLVLLLLVSPWSVLSI